MEPFLQQLETNGFSHKANMGNRTAWTTLSGEWGDQVLVCWGLKELLWCENFNAKPVKSWAKQDALTTPIWNKQLAFSGTSP